MSGSYDDEYRVPWSTKPERVKVYFKEAIPRYSLVSKHKTGSQRIRGRITGFSKKARSRAIQSFAKIEKGFFKFRFELTYPDDVMEELTVEDRGKKASHDVHRFQDYIKRRYPGAGIVWKKEWERRKSGELADEWVPHVHFMAGHSEGWKDSDWYTFYLDIAQKWVRITGTRRQGDALRVALHGKSFGMLAGERYRQYFTKYISKPLELQEFYTGRTWGTIGRLPYPEPKRYALTSGQSYWVQRLIRRYLRATQKVKRLRNGVKVYERAKRGYTEKWRKPGFEGFCLMDGTEAERIVSLAMKLGAVA